MNKKTNIIKITLWGLTVLIIALSVVIGFQIDTNKKLNIQIDALKEVNKSLEEDKVGNYVVLNFVDVDGTITPYLVDKTLELTIFEFLLTKDFSADDFESYDGENYYFKDSMTDVLELKDNENYYETNEWGGVIYTSLVVGLNKIKIDRNYTVIKTGF